MQQAGQLTTELILQRIFLAIKNNDAALIASLVNRLPAKAQIIGQHLATLQKDPPSLWNLPVWSNLLILTGK
ncbi:MAG TPA: hypothetical protein ACHBX0_06120 [Arsenophonus sp.]